MNNSDDTKDLTLEVLTNGQRINLFEKYDQVEVYTPQDLDITDNLCMKILELQNEIGIFYYAHPYKLDDFQQNKADAMELNLDELKMIIRTKIENL